MTFSPGTKVRITVPFDARKVGSDSSVPVAEDQPAVVDHYQPDFHSYAVETEDGFFVWVDADDLKEDTK